MQYIDIGVQESNGMGPQAQALRLQASPLPALAAWALALALSYFVKIITPT